MEPQSQESKQKLVPVPLPAPGDEQIFTPAPLSSLSFGGSGSPLKPTSSQAQRILQLQRMIGNARTVNLVRPSASRIQRVDDPPTGIITPEAANPATAADAPAAEDAGPTLAPGGAEPGERGAPPGDGVAAPPEAADRWTDADQQMLDAAVARVGVIESYQASLVPQAVRVLSQENYDNFRQLLTDSGSDLERGFLCKALAAGRSQPDITRFAERIRGRSERWLLRNLNLVNWSGGGGGVTQSFSDSCAPTTVQAFHGLYDPIYALFLRSQGNIAQQPGNAATNPGSVSNQSMMGEQRRLLTGAGGATADRAAPAGGSGINDRPWSRLVNQLSQTTGLRYRPRGVPSPLSWNRAFNILNTNLDQGIHVPAGVSGPGGGHAVLIIQRSGNRYQIHDPWTGQTVWRRRSAFINNTLNLPSGWNIMDMIMVPRRVQARSTRESVAPPTP